jgi:hypothetical protein
MVFEDGKIENASFWQYEVPRMKDLPELDIHLLDRPDLPAPAPARRRSSPSPPRSPTPSFRATGVRLRSMPAVAGQSTREARPPHDRKADRQINSVRSAANPTREVLRNHGINEPVFGVKIEELKKNPETRVRKGLGPGRRRCTKPASTTRNTCAGLIADETKVTPKDFRRWLARANSAVACGNVVATVAADSPHGWTLAREWIDSTDELTAQTGLDHALSGFSVSVSRGLGRARAEAVAQTGRPDDP